MPYQGNIPATQFQANPSVQQFSGDGSTTTFTLTTSVSSIQSVLVSVDGNGKLTFTNNGVTIASSADVTRAVDQDDMLGDGSVAGNA